MLSGLVENLHFRRDAFLLLWLVKVLTSCSHAASLTKVSLGPKRLKL